MVPTRRALLGTSGSVVTAALAGCVQGTTASDGGGPDWRCSEGDTAKGQNYDAVYTDDDVFEMTADPDPVALGESTTVSMVNASGETVGTSNKGGVSIQYDDDNGWTEITYFTADGTADPYFEHDPGEGYEWTFEMRRESLETLSNFSICADLVPGTYRFVYWGLLREDAANPALGATIEVME